MVTLQEQAYNHIKNMIIQNKLTYHEIYSETKLAKEIGISRTPLRDAIHRLVQEGFIDIIPSKGFQLHQLTLKDVEETFQVRSALESYCTLQITKEYQTQKAQELFDVLDSLVAHLKEIMDTSHSIRTFSDYDFEFHIRIIDYVDNRIFTNIFQSYMYKIQSLAILSLSHEHRMEHTYQEHVAILDAMKQGNVKDIYEITMVHMDTPKCINMKDLAGILNDE
ncbi:GntR family transcriptional regulator [Lachnospiraceae bacterium LCP25S3_G4]